MKELLKILIWQICIYYCFNKRPGSYSIPSYFLLLWWNIFYDYGLTTGIFRLIILQASFWKSINFNFGQQGSLLVNQHLLSCSQNIKISFSRLKKNCWLLYFLCNATSQPLPKCATKHIVSLENFDSNVSKGTMFREKNSPKQIAFGGAESNTRGGSWEQLLWSSIDFESWGTGRWYMNE